MTADTTSTPTPTPRAGRNLPVAIGVGLVLGGLIVGSLLLVQWGFVALATVSLMVGVWELARGCEAGAVKVRVPLIPCLLSTALLGPVAYAWGPGALVFTMAATLLLLVLWRSARGLDGAARDVSAGAFVVAYAPFQGAFSALMAADTDGPKRIFLFCLITVASDIGGYAVGVLAGKHPMAPSVSPKKSWEGFAGSLAACVVAGAIGLPLVLGGAWWGGALMGFVVVWLATMGDLTESMIKRDLGIKDLGTILPGHGGLMDRLDSLIIAAPATWIMLTLLVPPT